MVLATLAAGAVAVMAIWWVDTPSTSLSTFADKVTAAGRVTGLVGTYLLIIQVVLMARIPWLDRFIGSDRLSAWHRTNGQYTVGLLVAHAALTIWGYARFDHVSVVSETNTVVRTYTDMVAATVGLFLLVAIGVTSARWARRRLKYQTWYFVHLYTYLGLALSFSHQLATGNDFVTHRSNRVWWALLYGVPLVLLLIHRVAVPIRDGFRHRLRVASVVTEGPNAVSVQVTGRDLEQLRAESGQFFRWRFLTRRTWWEAHPYSLSAAPNPQFLRLTAKGDGDHSDDLRVLRPGVRVMTEGPYGAFTARRARLSNVLLIAGGVGITPLRAMLETMAGDGTELTLLYRAHSHDDVLFADELRALAGHDAVTVHLLLGSRDHQRGLTPGGLAQLVPGVADHDVYVCGPPGMVKLVRTSLRSLGVRRSQIHTERFEL